jgi:hypothetical protein
MAVCYAFLQHIQTAEIYILYFLIKDHFYQFMNSFKFVFFFFSSQTFEMKFFEVKISLLNRNKLLKVTKIPQREELQLFFGRLIRS